MTEDRMKDERTAEEWGRVAVSLPGWRWIPGMLACVNGTVGDCTANERGRVFCDDGALYDFGPEDGWSQESICKAEWPDPDDPATAGALWELAGRPSVNTSGDRAAVWSRVDGRRVDVLWHRLGRACIALAEALGRWPGGAE